MIIALLVGTGLLLSVLLITGILDCVELGMTGLGILFTIAFMLVLSCAAGLFTNRHEPLVPVSAEAKP